MTAKTRRNLIRAGIGTAGAALLMTGLLAGQYAQTMQRAIRVCLECIGIG